MRKRPLYIILILILIMLLSGCLPKVPETITGPTWTSKYRMPLIKLVGDYKIYFNHEPADETGANLELDELNTDLSFTFGADQEPITFELMDKPLTVNLDTISGITVEVPSPGVAVEVEVGEDDPRTIDLSFGDLNDYVNLKLSDNQDSVNYIEIALEGATATGDGFSIILMQGTSELKRATIKDGSSSEKLYLSGLEFFQDNELSIKAYGRLITTELTNEIGITFNPATLEIASFTITEESFEQNLTDEFQIEPQEEMIELGEMADFELDLKTASLTFKPTLPENIKITAQIKLVACDDNGNELASFARDITLSDSKFSSEDCNKLDLIEGEENINTILESKPHNLKLILENFVVEATGDLTLSYQDDNNISLPYEMNLGVETFTFSPEEDTIETGEIEIPDDLPLNFVGGEIFFEINNTSAAGLRIDFWLSNDHSTFNDKNKFSAVIEPNKSSISSSKITTEHFDLFRENDLLYYKLEITNLSTEATGEKFDETDYLEFSTWLDLDIKVNPR